MMPQNASEKPVPLLTLVITTDGDATVVRCTGKLVAGTTGILQTEVRGLLPGSKRIVLDLTDLGYMDSTGLGSIIGLYVSAKTAGGRLEVINLSQRVRHLFSVTNVVSLFEVCGEHNIRIP
ncbi:MAG: anti-sigma-factor antagonist [Bryobacterales bacterium]|jgi:anti-sigma B factor antagonist|nr:anti-sigma-factor antagonist [Bryobacterales bacterium]